MCFCTCTSLYLKTDWEKQMTECGNSHFGSQVIISVASFTWKKCSFVWGKRFFLTTKSLCIFVWSRPLLAQRCSCVSVSVWVPLSPRTARAKEEIYVNMCIINAESSFLGHAPGVPGPGEGAGPWTPPLCAGPSIKKEKESGISVVFSACAANQPSTPQRLTALHALTRQHELTEQHWKPVAQTHPQVWPGKTNSVSYIIDIHARLGSHLLL